MIELLPESSIGYSALGGCLFYTGDIAQARTNLERAVEIGSRYDAFANLATLEFYEARYAEAAELYSRALELDDSDHEVWSYLGEALLFAGADAGRVREAYGRAAELAGLRLDADPENQELLAHIASLEVHLGNELRARDLIARALSDEVRDPNVMFTLAVAFEDLGDRGDALQWVERCIGAGFPLEVVEDYPGFEDLVQDPAFQQLKTAPAPENLESTTS